ncbi:MAG: hydantoinase/oxoprolinase family protein [Planctomycetota bacterium]
MASDPLARHPGGSAARPRIGVDTGGTFTDLVLAAPGEPLRTCKVASTPEDPGRALIAGLEELGRAGAEGATVIHGTTVALNALLTRRVGAAALVTNEGFEDLVEIDRQTRPDLYALEPVRPEPLVPRERRFGVPQRSAPTESRAGASGGRVVETRRPSDEEIARVADAVVASGARSVAVCLLHSYADPEPERRIAAALAVRGLDVTTSAGLVAEYREAERFSTATCNAALVPVVRTYLERLGASLTGARLDVLQSSGGGLSADRAAREPVRILLSGPAGGVVGAAHAAEEAGLGAIATLDMGGTSTDVAFHAPGAGLSSLAEEVRVAGHSIAVPTLDMHTVGCGGGSLARVDAGGILRVGPMSAGADPGPVSFGRGGTEPTVTDAYVVLGLIAPRAGEGGFLGGRLELDVDAAHRVYESLGRALGVDAVRAAAAVIDAANASMRRALGVMTMQRGRDPRATPLVAFGGGGGLAAAALARALGMPSALVPREPGVLSALGMTRAERTADRSSTVLRPLGDVGRTVRAAQLRELCDAARAALSADSDAKDDGDYGDVQYETGLALRYRGQSYELSLPDSDDVEAAFHAAHEARFGWRLEGQEVQLVHLRARAMRTATRTASDGAAPGASEADRASSTELSPSRVVPSTGTRSAVFDGRAVEVPTFERALLREGDAVEGPAIVDEYSGTTVVPPRTTARVVGSGGLLISP